MTPMRIVGLLARTVDVQFAFVVLRLRTPVDRTELLALADALAPIAGDALAGWKATVPTALPEPLHWVVLPWQPTVGDAVAAQRQSLAMAAETHPLTGAWFHQSTTRLNSTPAVTEAPDDDPWWTQGLPPSRPAAPLPVDGLAAIDACDPKLGFGVALKLEGPCASGIDSVMAAFLALWLTPYEGFVGQAGVLVDGERQAVWLWADSFDLPSASASGSASSLGPLALAEHLFAVIGALHEVVPLVHGRLAVPSVEDRSAIAPFVYAGNPLLAAWFDQGMAGVDALLMDPGPWTARELAHMLVDLAGRVTTPPTGLPGADQELGELARSEGDREQASPRPPRKRALGSVAARVLAERAAKGLLHRKALEPFRAAVVEDNTPIAARCAILRVLGQTGDVSALPDILSIVDGPSAAGAAPQLVSAALEATVRLPHPMAVPALLAMVAREDIGADRRGMAALALALCLTAPGGRRPLSDRQLASVLALLRASSALVRAQAAWALARLAAGQDRTTFNRIRDSIEAMERADALTTAARAAALRLLGADLAMPALIGEIGEAAPPVQSTEFFSEAALVRQMASAWTPTVSAS